MLKLNTDKELPPIPVLQGTGWSLDLTVSGQSMEPLIRAGDTITIKCSKPDGLKEGDVVCFQDDDSFVLHRLIEVSGTDDKCFYEKGDAESKGRWIAGSAVLGVLVSINGTPVDEKVSQQITQFSRRERDASELLGKIKLSPQPNSKLSNSWRKIKSLLRRSVSSEGQ